ncbi:MAG: glycosyltransferase family 39 protein [Puniceicoccales bacterium]|jgi:hypothetical protein|nr:glycosyltransferase family 39 protein [Puniceicoccales bacterium]
MTLFPFLSFAASQVEQFVFSSRSPRPQGVPALWHGQTSLLFSALILCAAFAGVLFFRRRHRCRSVPDSIGDDRCRHFFFQGVLFFGFVATTISLALMGERLWVDETFTLLTLKNFSLSEIIAVQQTDVHPPLYYLLAKIWTLLFGFGVNSLEIFSVVPMVLTIGALSLFLNREYSLRAGTVFLLSVNTVGAFVKYATDIRGYTLAFFFVTLTALCAWRILNADRPRAKVLACVGFAFFGVCAAYTHYYAGAFVALGGFFLALFAIWKRRPERLPIVVTGAVMFLLYLPWISVPLRHFQNASADFWIPPMTLGRCVRYVLFAFDPDDSTVVGFLCSWFLLALFCGAVVAFWRRQKSGTTGGQTTRDFFFPVALLAPLLLFAAMLLYGFLKRNLIEHRYFFPVYGILWAFFAIEVAKCSASRSRVRFLFPAVTGSMLVIWLFVTLPGALVVERTLNAEHDAIVGAIQREARPRDLVFMLADVENAGREEILRFHLPEQAGLHLEHRTAATAGGKPPAFERFWGRRFLELFPAETPAPARAFSWASHPDAVAWVVVGTGSAEMRSHFLSALGAAARPVAATPSVVLYKVVPAALLDPWLRSEHKRIGGKIRFYISEPAPVPQLPQPPSAKPVQTH